MSYRHGNIRRGRGRRSRVTQIPNDLLAAFQLLTRLPVARFTQPDAPPNLARCVWAFSLVGLVVNAVGGLVYWLSHWLAMPPLLAAVWALATTMVMTGALHEDGLADTADGFGGGDTAERTLRIMRDSHIGAYGALALLISVLARVTAIAELGDPQRVMVAFCLAGMLGRAGILVLLLALRPARDDGMGAAIAAASPGHIWAGLVIAVIACLVAVPAKTAIAMIAAALIVSLAVVRLAKRQIDGYTGDVLGACEVIVECVVLTIAASAPLF